MNLNLRYRKNSGLAVILLMALHHSVFSQSFILGSDATFYLGQSASFYVGGNTTFNGSFNNNGTLISNRDLNVVDNRRLNNLKFVGRVDQTLEGNDTLRVRRMTMEKASTLNLRVRRLIIEDGLDIISGVLGAGADTTLLVSGEITGGSNDGFIEGKLIHLTKSDVINFPLGVNGFYNALTLRGLPNNTIVIVECRVPDAARLIPTEDMVGISDEVEWLITAMSMQDSVEVNVSAIFNGVDLTEFSNGQEIRAQDYAPSIVKFGKGDTTYIDLGILDVRDTDDETFGTVDASGTFFISDEPTLLGIALVPLLLQPEFFVPNAFSPTGLLNENQIFRPYFAGAEITDVTFKVWDSFQNSMYSVSQSGQNLDLSQIGWDGFLPNGQIADEGVYYYSVNLVADGIRYSRAGSVLLTN